jgi:hypothetical protein
MFQFKQALAMGSVALFLIGAAAAPATAQGAGANPAAAKAAKAKRAGAKKSPKPTAAAKQPKVNVKASIAKTDKLLKAAAKSAGKGGHSDLTTATIQQVAARKALAAGKDKQAMFLSLDARRLARSVIADKGKKVPKGMATDSKAELAAVDPMDIEEFVEAALEEADGDHEEASEELPAEDEVDDADAYEEDVVDEY